MKLLSERCTCLHRLLATCEVQKWCDLLIPLKGLCLLGKHIDSRSEMGGDIQAPEGNEKPG